MIHFLGFQAQNGRSRVNKDTILLKTNSKKSARAFVHLFFSTKFAVRYFTDSDQRVN